MMKRWLCWFVVLILLDTSLAVSVSAQEEIAGDALGTETAAAETTAFSCELSSLSQAEAQQIQELLREGFVGEELSSGTEPNEDRDKLMANEVILTDPDNNEAALKHSLADEKIEPFEVAHLLNNYVKGAFAFGLVLDDSVPFNRDGKNVMAAFVLQCCKGVRPDDEVLAVNGKDELVAHGRALLNAEEMESFTRGVAVRVREGIQ